MREYASEYYQKNREVAIARQMEYHKKNREHYLAYMREYNKQYWLKNRPPPKPKKEKIEKEKKPAREPKEKQKKQKVLKEAEWFLVKEPEYPMKVERGHFTLAFD